MPKYNGNISEKCKEYPKNFARVPESLFIIYNIVVKHGTVILSYL